MYVQVQMINDNELAVTVRTSARMECDSLETRLCRRPAIRLPGDHATSLDMLPQISNIVLPQIMMYGLATAGVDRLVDGAANAC